MFKKNVIYRIWGNTPKISSFRGLIYPWINILLFYFSGTNKKTTVRIQLWIHNHKSHAMNPKFTCLVNWLSSSWCAIFLFESLKNIAKILFSFSKRLWGLLYIHSTYSSISVFYLYVITQEPFNRFALNFDCGTMTNVQSFVHKF